MELIRMYWIFCIIVFVGIVVVKYRKYNVHRALQLPKNPPHYPDSAIRSAKEIGKFLFERAEVCGVYYHMSAGRTGITVDDMYDISHGKDYGVVNLIRMAHYLGCEVVIRQVGTTDTEDPAMTPQVYKEYIANLEDEALRRRGIR